VSVAAGDSTTLVFSGVADGTATYEITADGVALPDETFEIDCAGVPAVSASSECSATGGVVTLELSNTAPVGFKAVEFVVSGPGTPDGPTTVSVAAGDSTTLVFSGVADGTATYEITADGVALPDETFEIDCAGVGGATLARECVDNDGTVTITVSNTSPAGSALPVEFVVSGPGTATTPTTVSVAAGSSAQVVFTGVADGEVTYTVTADGVEIDSFTFEVECDDPGVPEVDGFVECTGLGGDVVLVLGNDGVPGKNLPITFRVTAPVGGEVADYTVDPGETVNVVFPNVPDGSYTIGVSVIDPATVTSAFLAQDAGFTPAAEISFDQELTVACTPIAEIECAEGGFDVILNNGGDTEVEMSVLKNGSVVETVTIPAFGGVVPVFVPAEEGETLSISVSVDGEVAITETITRDCDAPPPDVPPGPEVLGVTQAQPPAAVVTPAGALPYTGGEVMRTVLLGLGLALAGIGLVAFARRRA
jgi:LPXTG-motif cell wall-anchored protein